MKSVTDNSRRSRCFWLVVFAITSGGLVLTVAQGSSLPENRIQKLESRGVTSDRANQASASKCIQCHQFEQVLTHPVNVYASTLTNASLPLQGGLITCLTCHDAAASHVSKEEKVGIRAGDSVTLCLQCHTSAAATRSSHPLSFGQAHMKADNSKLANLPEAGLDLESQNCLGCHDGAVAGGAVSHSVQSMDSQGSAEHPIGVPLVATNRTKDGDFRMANPRTLDRRIRLSGGNLACTSCHSLYSTEPAKLVMSNQGSKLCLSCHTQ